MAHCQGWRLLRSTDDVSKKIPGHINVESREFKMKEHQSNEMFCKHIGLTLDRYQKLNDMFSFALIYLLCSSFHLYSFSAVTVHFTNSYKNDNAKHLSCKQ